MARRPNDAVHRHIKVTFSQEQAEEMNAFREAAGMPDMQTAIRAACKIAVAFDPDEGFRSAAVERAFNERRRWVQTRLGECLMEMAEQLRMMNGETDE